MSEEELLLQANAKENEKLEARMDAMQAFLEDQAIILASVIFVFVLHGCTLSLDQTDRFNAGMNLVIGQAFFILYPVITIASIIINTMYEIFDSAT